MRFSFTSIACIALGLSLVDVSGEELSKEHLDFFESKIRPVLADACYECHSNDGGRVKGGLALDTRDAMMLGGDSGGVITPGNPDDSLLWIAMSYTDGDYEMPPKKQLAPEVVADFREWIEMGAPDPRVVEKQFIKSEIDIEEGREFWSFQPPVISPVPATKNTHWATDKIDHFILATLEKSSLSPAPDASPETLIRRLSYDLIGLPPTPDEQRTFLVQWEADPARALEFTVDRLLASERFGERWGRHWLDVVRYAESTGKETNMAYPHAWRYRDYVIDSFNADKPYDYFLTQQIAGDLIPVKTDGEWQENLIATAYLALGSKGLNQDNSRQFQMDVVDEQIDTVSQSILGLTVSCARCHDHKFDPIPTTDYYSLAGIFLSSETYFGTVTNAQNKRPSELLLLPISDPVGERLSLEEMKSLQDRLASMRSEMIEYRGARDSMTGNAAGQAAQKALRTRSQMAMLQARLSGLEEDGHRKTFAMGVQTIDSPVEAAVLVRGEIDKPAQTVNRGFLQVMADDGTEPIPADSDGRRELAEWLTSEKNTLTARVMANRIWLQLFGEGIVRTPDNFGTAGQLPSHPELLDHLALQFIENDWSIKSLIRDIVLSRTYRMSSEFNSTAYSQDPENTLHWRANPRRLDAEAIRDSMLAVSGTIDLERPHGSFIAEMGDVRVGIRINEETINQPSFHRSVYLPIVRDLVPEALGLFDFAEPDVVRGSRESTNVPSQALYLMNNDFVTAQAKAMGDRLLSEFDSSEEQIAGAFRLAINRQPSQEETRTAAAFLKKLSASIETENTNHAFVFSMFCQGLISSAEFRYLY